MKSFFLAFVALTLAVDAAIAIECYNCGYVDGAEIGDTEDLPFDKSCQSGKKPNKKYNEDCGAGFDSCAKVVLEEGDMKGTIRTCWSSQLSGLIGLEAEKCTEKSGKDLSDFLGSVGFPVPGIPTSAKVTVCSCTGDKCNSSSMVKVTQGSLMILVIGFLTSKFMY